MATHAAGLAILASIVFGTGGVIADTSVVAQALFEEARRAMASGDDRAACAKFAESQRLEPAGGTLLNLASCHARIGKTATAWTEFHDALTQAERDGRAERVDEARRQIAELEPRLGRLTIEVAAPSTGLEVSLDGVVLGPASWGLPIPVDPGWHEVHARAAGRREWSQRIEIAPGTMPRMHVPPLAPEGAPTLPSLLMRSRPHEGAPPVAVAGWPRAARTHAVLPVTALVVASAGVAAAAAGAYFGVVAIKAHEDASHLCSAAGCTAAGMARMRAANSAAWASDIGIGVGVTAVAAAALMLLVSPAKPPSPRLAVSLLPFMPAEGCGVAAVGLW